MILHMIVFGMVLIIAHQRTYFPIRPICPFVQMNDLTKRMLRPRRMSIGGVTLEATCAHVRDEDLNQDRDEISKIIQERRAQVSPPYTRVTPAVEEVTSLKSEQLMCQGNLEK